MRHIGKAAALILSAFCPGLVGQSFEFGVAGGYGTYRQASYTSGSISGDAGFKSSYAFGAAFGQNHHKLFGGEARYTYRRDPLSLKYGGQTITSAGESHALHYDVLVHATGRESAVRPFLAGGAGIKYFRGVGNEPAFQPGSDVVVLTHASEAKPLVSFGGGVKIAFSKRGLIRLDFRDYATPFPDSVIVPRRGTTISGWLHDFVFLVGIGVGF